MTKKGQINIGYKARRIGFNDTEKLVGQASRYSTIAQIAVGTCTEVNPCDD